MCPYAGLPVGTTALPLRCLLSSRSRVRVAVGAQVRDVSYPQDGYPGSLSIRLSRVSETKISRRGRGEDTIYFATAKNRYVGSVSLGYGPTEASPTQGLRPDEAGSPGEAQDAAPGAERRSQVVQHLYGAGSRGRLAARGLDGTSERTRILYQGLLEPVLELIGAKPLRVLSAGEVRSALGPARGGQRPRRA
jgi:hypothetical protein